MKIPSPALRAAAVSLSVAVCAALAGCGGVTFAGRVIAGPANIASVVPASDPRLESATGVGGVLIELKDEKQNLVGSGVSDLDGKFAISVPTANAPTRPTIVRSTGKGLQAAETTLYLPRDGSRLLVNVKDVPVASSDGAPRQ